jgi:sodium-dependent dicarboxylate transporter 2/3/5
MKFGRLFRLRFPNPPFGPGRIISSGHIGTLLGIGLFLLVVFLPITELSFGQRIVFGTALWMATWWILGAVPLYVTAFLPLLIFPLTGVNSFADTTVIYADRLVFLLLGGFILARAIETTGLHQRFALTILKILPSQNPTIVIGAFMLVTASISAWLCNTATTLMILPIAVAVITQVNNPEDKDRFGACLMLAVAYAASLGGIATLVGTPPNVLCASIAHRMFGLDITFSHWVMIGVPITAISLLVNLCS